MGEYRWLAWSNVLEESRLQEGQILNSLLQCDNECPNQLIAASYEHDLPLEDFFYTKQRRAPSIISPRLGSLAGWEDEIGGETIINLLGKKFKSHNDEVLLRLLSRPQTLLPSVLSAVCAEALMRAYQQQISRVKSDSMRRPSLMIPLVMPCLSCLASAVPHSSDPSNSSTRAGFCDPFLSHSDPEVKPVATYSSQRLRLLDLLHIARVAFASSIVKEDSVSTKTSHALAPNSVEICLYGLEQHVGARPDISCVECVCVIFVCSLVVSALERNEAATIRFSRIIETHLQFTLTVFEQSNTHDQDVARALILLSLFDGSIHGLLSVPALLQSIVETFWFDMCPLMRICICLALLSHARRAVRDPSRSGAVAQHWKKMTSKSILAQILLHGSAKIPKALSTCDEVVKINQMLLIREFGIHHWHTAINRLDILLKLIICRDYSPAALSQIMQSVVPFLVLLLKGILYNLEKQTNRTIKCSSYESATSALTLCLQKLALGLLSEGGSNADFKQDDGRTHRAFTNSPDKLTLASEQASQDSEVLQGALTLFLSSFQCDIAQCLLGSPKKAILLDMSLQLLRVLRSSRRSSSVSRSKTRSTSRLKSSSSSKQAGLASKRSQRFGVLKRRSHTDKPTKALTSLIRSVLIIPGLIGMMTMSISDLYVPAASDILAANSKVAGSWSYKAQRTEWRRYYRCLKNFSLSSLGQSSSTSNTLFSNFDAVTNRLSKISPHLRPIVTALLSMGGTVMKEDGVRPPLSFLIICLLSWGWAPETKLEKSLELSQMILDLSLWVLKEGLGEDKESKRAMARSYSVRVYEHLASEFHLLRHHLTAESSCLSVVASPDERSRALEVLTAVWQSRAGGTVYHNPELLLDPEIISQGWVIEPRFEAVFVYNLIKGVLIHWDSEDVPQMIYEWLSKWINYGVKITAGKKKPWTLNIGMRTRLVRNRLEASRQGSNVAAASVLPGLQKVPSAARSDPTWHKSSHGLTSSTVNSTISRTRDVYMRDLSLPTLVCCLALLSPVESLLTDKVKQISDHQVMNEVSSYGMRDLCPISRQNYSLARFYFFQRMTADVMSGKPLMPLINQLVDFWASLTCPLDLPGGSAWLLSVFQYCLILTGKLHPILHLKPSIAVPSKYDTPICANGLLEMSCTNCEANVDHVPHGDEAAGCIEHVSEALSCTTTLVRALQRSDEDVDHHCSELLSILLSQQPLQGCNSWYSWSLMPTLIDFRIGQMMMPTCLFSIGKSSSEVTLKYSALSTLRLCFEKDEAISCLTKYMGPDQITEQHFQGLNRMPGQFPVSAIQYDSRPSGRNKSYQSKSRPRATQQRDQMRGTSSFVRFILQIPYLCRLFQLVRSEGHAAMSDSIGSPSIHTRWSRLATFALRARPVVDDLHLFIKLISTMASSLLPNTRLRTIRDVSASFLAALLEGTQAFHILLATTKDLIRGHPKSRTQHIMNSVKGSIPFMHRGKNVWLERLSSAITDVNVLEAVMDHLATHESDDACQHHSKRITVDGLIFCVKKSSHLKFNAPLESLIGSDYHEGHAPKLQLVYSNWLDFAYQALSDTLDMSLLSRTATLHREIFAETPSHTVIKQARIWSLMTKAKISSTHSGYIRACTVPVDLLTLPAYGLSWNLRNLYKTRKQAKVPSAITFCLSVRSLCAYDNGLLNLFLPQLVATLKGDSTRILETALHNFAIDDARILKSLYRALGVSSGDVKDLRLDAVDSKDFFRRCLHVVSISRLRESIIQYHAGRSQDQSLLNEMNFFEDLMDISAGALAAPAPLRRQYITTEVAKVCVSKGFPITQQEIEKVCRKERSANILSDPFTGNTNLIGVDALNCRPLKSASRVPFMVPFWACNDTSTGDVKSLCCIMKAHDDLRLDELALQMIHAMQSLLVGSGLPLWFCPYRVRPVLSKGQYGGVIEMVQHTRSRHEIGKEFKVSLKEYFEQYFDDSFLPTAQWNFLRSAAAYSIATFLLQIKDRHNANVLITDDGFTVHIDFGFILDLSPAGDLRFERAPFKMTQDMMNLLNANFHVSKDDAEVESEKGFLLLRHLIIEGYLTLRAFRGTLYNLLRFYSDQSLPCFKSRTLKRFKHRLQFDSRGFDVLRFIDNQLNAAVNAFTTRLYDVVQSLQQGIAY